MKLQLLKQRVNYDDVVKGKHLDHETYKKKFVMWDYVLKHKLLEKQDKTAMRLLNDPTIYAYAFFKNDENQRLRLTAYQDAIINLRHDFAPDNPNRYILFQASNQIGKSLMLCLLAIFLANTERNKNIVMISRSLKQSQFLLAEIRQLLNNSVFGDTWRETTGETANTTQLTFQRDEGKVLNRIICAPVGEGTLGYPVHYLFLDEVDFYEEAKTFFWKVAFPRTKKTKGQIICFSNPNAEISRSQSILWELWQGKDEKDRLFNRRFTFNFLDAPWNTQAEYDRDKRNSPSHIFISTHDGMFPQEGGAFFSWKEIQDMLCRDWNNTGLPSFTEETVYIGMDLGKMYDQTVIGIGTTKKSLNEVDKYDDLDVRYTEEFQVKTDYSVIVNRLLTIREHYREQGKRVVIGFDATAQETFGDLSKKMGLSMIPVDFRKKETNKTLLFNDFKLMAENRKIKVVYSSKCEKQLSELMFTLTETKKLKKVEARKEHIHDDYCDMMAILIHIAVKPSKVPVSMTNVEQNQTTQPKKVDSVTEMENYMRETFKRNRPNYFGGNDGLEGFREW